MTMHMIIKIIVRIMMTGHMEEDISMINHTKQIPNKMITTMMMIIIMDGKIINDKHKLFIKILIN